MFRSPRTDSSFTLMPSACTNVRVPSTDAVLTVSKLFMYASSVVSPNSDSHILASLFQTGASPWTRACTKVTAVMRQPPVLELLLSLVVVAVFEDSYVVY